MELPAQSAPSFHDSSCSSSATRPTANWSTARTGGQEPEFSTLVTTNQTPGRGRLGRNWVAPPGQTLAVSVLLQAGAADR